ncbi:lamina-associated polypeptide 2, isoforms alpha/zeta-like [Rhinophrynus dorsalis]
MGDRYTQYQLAEHLPGSSRDYHRDGGDRSYGYSAVQSNARSGVFPLFRQERDQSYDGRTVERATEVQDCGYDIDALIRTVLDTLHLSCVDVPEDPSKTLFRKKPKPSASYPAFDPLDQIVLEEWKCPDREMYVSESYKQLYPFSKACLDLWETAPEIDPLFSHFCDEGSMLASGVGNFQDIADNKMDNLLKMSFTASGAALRPNFAIAWVSRAIGQWCDLLVQSIRKDAPKEDLLRLVARVNLANNYLGDAALNGVNFTARASALSVAARRALWLKACPANMATKNLIVSLPFRGKVLFGPELDKLVDHRSGGTSSLLPQFGIQSTHPENQTKRYRLTHTNSSQSRPVRYQTKQKTSWKGKKPNKKAATNKSRVGKKQQSGSQGS